MRIKINKQHRMASQNVFLAAARWNDYRKIHRRFCLPADVKVFIFHFWFRRPDRHNPHIEIARPFAHEWNFLAQPSRKIAGVRRRRSRSRARQITLRLKITKKKVFCFNPNNSERRRQARLCVSDPNHLLQSQPLRSRLDVTVRNEACVKAVNKR